MARVKGRDVFLDVMDAVERLEKTSALHTEQMEHLAAISIEMSARMTAVETRISHISTRVTQLSSEVGFLAREVADLGASHNELQAGFVAGVKNARAQQENVARLAQALLRANEQHGTRFESLEARVSLLEKKTG